MRAYLNLLALAIFAAACQRDSAATTSVHGRYELAAVDGRSIPASRDVEATESPTCVDSLEAGWYELGAPPDTGEAPWQSSESAVLQCTGVTDTATLSQIRVDSGTFFIQDDTLRFRMPGTLVLWRGTVSGDTLSIRRQQFGQDYICCPHNYRYVRRTKQSG